MSEHSIAGKKVAFLPVFRTITPPADGPDIVPPDWPADILSRILYHPDPARGGADGSLRAWLLAASSGRADIDPVVLPMRTVDRIDVSPTHFEDELGDSLRAQGFDHACLVMLGGVGAGTNNGFWSRFVMKEHTGVWAMEMIHGISGMRDLYHLAGYVDPAERELVRVGMTLDRQHAADHHVRVVVPGAVDGVDGIAARGQAARDVLGIGFERDPLLEPRQRILHENCSRNLRSFSSRRRMSGMS